MEIKSIVKELSVLKTIERSLYIEDYLSRYKILYNILKFSNGKNIEVVKEGIDKQKEIIFFAHHDISNDTYEGANDNTSSVAIMLKIARYLQNVIVPFTVRIIFNDKEEILGALLNKSISIIESKKIINNVGSYQYLKDYDQKEKIIGIFILELSGIGDSLYFATKSGCVECDTNLLNFLSLIAEKNNFHYIKIPFLASDMISIHTTGLKGIVLGAIPRFEGIKFAENNNINLTNTFLPSIWKNIHSKKDNYFAIKEKSLEMVHNFILQIINNFDLLK